MTMPAFRIKSLVLAALLTAAGVLLPQALHAIPNAGSVLLPMHIPVLLCGMAAGSGLGAITGVLTVLLSMLLSGMPPLFPTGVSMMLELAVYGAVSGGACRLLRVWEHRRRVYPALILAMLAGRLVNGTAMALFMWLSGERYTLTAFLLASFVTALPGIILQLVILPPALFALERLHLTANP